jgi:hypothetical protein
MITRLVRAAWVAVFLLLAGCAVARVEKSPGLSATASIRPTLQLSALAAPTANKTLAPLVTASPSPVSGAACLTGNWLLADARQTFEQSLRSTNSKASLDTVEGSLAYAFDPIGKLAITYQQLQVQVRTSVKNGEMLTRSTLNGSAGADYMAAGNEMKLTHFGGEGVDLLFEIDGQPLFESNLPAWASFFSVVTHTSGAAPTPQPAPELVKVGFDCSGDSLTIHGPADIVLTRQK